MDIMVVLGIWVLVGVPLLVIAFVLSYISTIRVRSAVDSKPTSLKHRVKWSHERAGYSYFDECGVLIGCCFNKDSEQKYMESIAYSWTVSLPHDFNIYRKDWEFCFCDFKVYRVKHVEQLGFMWHSKHQPIKEQK